MHSFVVVNFSTHVVNVVLIHEAVALVPLCKIVVVLGFDAVADYVVDVLDSRVAAAFHLAVNIVVVTVLNPIEEIEVHIDVILLVLNVLQDVSTEIIYLTN